MIRAPSSPCSKLSKITGPAVGLVPNPCPSMMNDRLATSGTASSAAQNAFVALRECAVLASRLAVVTPMKCLRSMKLTLRSLENCKFEIYRITYRRQSMEDGPNNTNDGGKDAKEKSTSTDIQL